MAFTLEQIFTLFVIFQVKHLMADYFLQTHWMVVGKSQLGTKWILPLTVHCGVHAIFSFAILSFWAPQLWYLCAVDFVAHFSMDRLKASPNLLGRWKLGSANFFRIFGFDQMVHHLTHYWLAFMILSQGRI